MPVLLFDAAAPVLASLNEPILIENVDADKHTHLARKHDVDYVFLGPFYIFVCSNQIYFFITFFKCFFFWAFYDVVSIQPFVV